MKSKFSELSSGYLDVVELHLSNFADGFFALVTRENSQSLQQKKASETLRQLLANLLNKEIWIRKECEPSSIIGGIYVCNESYGIKISSATENDVTEKF